MSRPACDHSCIPQAVGISQKPGIIAGIRAIQEVTITFRMYRTLARLSTELRRNTYEMSIAGAGILRC